MKSKNTTLVMIVCLLCLQAGAAASVVFDSQTDVVREQATQPCHDDNPEPLVSDQPDCCDSKQNCGTSWCGMEGCQSILASVSTVNFYNQFSFLCSAPALALPQAVPDSLFRPPATAS